MAGHARPDGGREIHAVAGADFDQGADPGKRLDALGAVAGDAAHLQEVEDTCRMYSAYAWLGYRMPEYFPSIELAQELAREASERVDALLQQQNAAARKRQSKRERARW